jgi:hypothetical protein
LAPLISLGRRSDEGLKPFGMATIASTIYYEHIFEPATYTSSAKLSTTGLCRNSFRPHMCFATPCHSWAAPGTEPQDGQSHGVLQKGYSTRPVSKQALPLSLFTRIFATALRTFSLPYLSKDVLPCCHQSFIREVHFQSVS